MFSFLSATRRERLVAHAERERAKWINRQMALVLVLIYNMVGFADILSTQIAIGNQLAYEANPLMRAAMDELQWERAWVAIKLTLQFCVTAMVLWFPHRIVMALFGFVVVVNGAVVINNFHIAGML